MNEGGCSIGHCGCMSPEQLEQFQKTAAAKAAIWKQELIELYGATLAVRVKYWEDMKRRIFGMRSSIETLQARDPESIPEEERFATVATSLTPDVQKKMWEKIIEPLGERERQIMTARYVNRWPVTKIAQQIGCSERTIRRNRRQSLVKLQQYTP